jgi:hypothetical protein
MSRMIDSPMRRSICGGRSARGLAQVGQAFGQDGGRQAGKQQQHANFISI